MMLHDKQELENSTTPTTEIQIETKYDQQEEEPGNQGGDNLSIPEDHLQSEQEAQEPSKSSTE